MYPSDHVAKARRIERSLMKFDLMEDYEMVVECCMLATTHYYNAALHVEGISIPLIDQAHTFRPKLDMYRRTPSSKLQSGMERLKFIEQLRPKHCRKSEPVDRKLMENCIKSFEEGKSIFLEIIGDAGKPEFWTAQ